MESIMQWLQEQSGIALAFGFALAGFYFFFSLIRRGLREGKGQAITVRAHIISTQKLTPGEWEVTFETGGLIKRLRVDAQIAESLAPGHKGRLTYQGDLFIKFK